MKRALILGIGGQDGSYLADILLERGYTVHGLHRHSSVDNLHRIRSIKSKLLLHRGDITDHNATSSLIREIHPSEIYNVADQDSVPWSFSLPTRTFDVTTTAVANILETICQFDLSIKVFQPVSAVMFGDAPFPQTEDTPINPLSPYGVAKAATYHLCRYYRQVHDVQVWTGILYNHDSPRRSPGYLLQELAYQAVQVARGREKRIRVGDPHMIVDIGFARDYMEGAVDMLKSPLPHDAILASGSARDIHSIVLEALHIVNSDAGIVQDTSLLRPGPKVTLVGDNMRALWNFRFKPKTSFTELLRSIIDKLWEQYHD